jgi:hypothetical protein
MALALNVFKTITQVAPTSPVGIYTASTGYSGVVLLAQASNVGNDPQTVSLSHKRDSVTTEIVKTLPIEASDTASLLPGKLVCEAGDIIQLSASNATDIKFLISILETLK